MDVVVFDPVAFKARYPEFSSVSDVLLQDYFSEATIYLNNTGQSRVQDLAVRARLLGMLTAHITALYSGVNGEPASQLVGRITNAAEGSVSVAASMGAEPGTSGWYLQTKYGASYWQATAPFRTMQYVPGYSRPPVPRAFLWRP